MNDSMKEWSLTVRVGPIYGKFANILIRSQTTRTIVVKGTYKEKVK